MKGVGMKEGSVIGERLNRFLNEGDTIYIMGAG
jgi:hypothetical protein